MIKNVSHETSENEMSEKQQEWLVSASRILSAISGIFAPIILIIMVGIYNKLDSYGNRLTTLETQVSQMQKGQDKLEAQGTQLQLQYYEMKIKNNLLEKNSSNP